MDTLLRFCAAIGRRDWLENPAWGTSEGRSKERAAINAAIAAVTREKPRLHWIETLDEAGIPCGAINTIDQVFADPQVRHLALAKRVDHPRLGEQHIVGSAINLAGLDDSPRKASADAGSHTNEVLVSLGYSPDAIEALRAKRVI